MATKKDVRVKVRLNILSVLLKDKGDADQRPGRHGTQRKTIIDIPEFEISSGEFETRLEKAQQVLGQGYWVDPDDVPPTVVTDEVTDLTHNSVTLNGHVKPGGVLIATACGFEVGTLPTVAASVVATESPLSSADNEPITYAWAGLTPETKYYYRAFATDVNFSGGKYGIVKSFTTDAAP